MLVTKSTTKVIKTPNGTRQASTYMRKSSTVDIHQLLHQVFNLEGLRIFVLPGRLKIDLMQQILQGDT